MSRGLPYPHRHRPPPSLADTGSPADSHATAACPRLPPSVLKVDGRHSIAPPLDAERIISDQLPDHGVISARGTVIPDQCRAWGRLIGQSIVEHQARVIRNRLVQAGLMREGERTR